VVADANDETLRAGTVIGGRYRIERALRARSLGVLYAGTDDQGAPISLEVFGGDAITRGGQTVARFIDGARVAQRLRGRAFVAIREVSVDDLLGAPFLVAEAVVGEHLDAVLERSGPLAPDVAVRIALQAAAALAHAHRAGIVHRDVRPSNLLLAEVDGEIVVKVVDFGLARDEAIDRAAQTEEGTLLGTPLYMSPEQARARRDIDGRADVFGLAITLWEMLAGKPARTGATSLAELLIALCNDEVADLQQSAPWIEPRLASIVHGALLLDRDGRCPSMEAFADALRPLPRATDRLLPEELQPLTPESRSKSADRATRPTSWAMATAAERDRLLGSTLAQRYRLTRCLGRGGMGAVYEANTPDGARVAVKVIHETDSTRSPENRRRFVREARAASQIESDHVVKVIEADADAAIGVPFIVMELLEGTDLEKIISRNGALDAVVVTRMFLQACRGLGAAHARGTVHRDIKPANLFLAHAPGGDVRLKICDFGIAKTTAADGLDATTAALTKTGGMLGSPAYMSPEQARNARGVDVRSDVWSLCMSMYEAYSGVRPWSQCSSLGEMILAICTESMPPLEKVAPWIDPRLAQIVHKGLQRELKDRWQSVEELAAALGPFANGSAAISREMLAPLDDSARSRNVPVEAPTVSSQSFDRTTAAGSTTSATRPSDVPRRRRAPLVFAAIAALAVGGTAFALMRTPPTPPTAPANPTAPESAQPVTAAKARVAIQPASATVTVNGKPQDVIDGAVSLEGLPGDTFTIAATVGTIRIEREVTILRGGLVRPDQVTVAVPAAASAKPGPVPPTKASAPTKATTTATATPPPPPKPTATAGPTPTFQNSW